MMKKTLTHEKTLHTLHKSTLDLEPHGFAYYTKRYTRITQRYTNL